MRPFFVSLAVFLLMGVQVAHAATKPVADIQIAPGAHAVLMLSYPLREGCYSYAVIRNMTLVYDGASSKNIRTVYAKVNGKTVTTRRMINPQNYLVTLWFDPANPPGLCYSGHIDIYADFSNTATIGSLHSLMVERSSDVVSDQGTVGIPVHGLWVGVARPH